MDRQDLDKIVYNIPGWWDMPPVERSYWMWGVKWIAGMHPYRQQWFDEDRQAVARQAAEKAGIMLPDLEKGSAERVESIKSGPVGQ